MAKYSAVKATVNAYIKQNGRKEITGKVLNAVLNATIDSLGKYFQFAGGALPTDNPGTPDQNVCYLAGEPGVYTNFGGIAIENEEVALLFWNGEWTKQRILIGIREVNASVDNQVGTPSVDVSYSGGELVLTFHNLKGGQGETGDPAGFGTIGADINGGVGTPGVSVETSGDNTAKNLMFHFTNLKGETGVTSVVATIDDTSGTPSCQVSLVGQQLTLAFSGLKGLKGDTGVSADYPITIYNGLDSDATDQALAAAQGKVLDGKVSQLGQKLIDSSYLEFVPEVQETDKAIDSNGNIINYSSYRYSKSFNLEKGDVVFINCVIIATMAALSKYENGVYIPLLIGEPLSPNIVNKHYFIADSGEYVLCWSGTLKFFVAKNIPLRLSYDTLFNRLRTTDGLSISKEDFKVNNIYTGSSSAGYRLRLACPIPNNSKVVASCSLGKGVAVSIYNNETQVAAAGSDYLQTISYSYVHSVEAVANYDGILVVSLCKKDNSQFTPQDIEDFLAATTITVTHNVHLEETQELLREIENFDETHELFIGTLLQKSITASELSDSNKDYRVSTATCMVVPKEQATLKFRLPDGYYVGIRNGDQSRNLTVNSYWFGNGDFFTFGANIHYFRFCFAHINGAPSSNNYLPITVQEVNELIANGEIKLFVEEWENDIIKQNSENEKYIKAVMRNFVSGAGNNGSLHKLPIFAHTSDVHGDANRVESFAKFCDYIGVDAALVSGDMVATDPVDSMQYINDIMDSHSTKILISTGNHDTVGLQTAQSQYESIMGHCIGKYSGIVTNPSETYPTYYYYDFADKNIRLISINLYETDHTDHQCKFTQTQCEWLIATLAATPANYGVLIMFHSPEARPSKDANYATFYQDILNWTGYHVGLSGNVFRSIIDAFIGKTSATITYTSKGESITVSADFTNVASGVEFIAWVNGHLHVDEVGYIPGATHKQLNLNVNCGVAVYGSTYKYLANNSDLPRGCNGTTQDCFNIYAIDRDAKTVRIAKVGSNVSGDLKERKYMSIPYAD